MSSDEDVVTYSVNLTPTSQRCLDETILRGSDTATDVLNRAVQTYAYLTEIWAGGGDVLIRRSDDGALELLKIY